MHARCCAKKTATRPAQLAKLKNQAQGHALVMWVDYWELANRLNTAQQPELDGFYKRWSGTYVEDRLRNDWLLELGRRRDFTQFRIDHRLPHAGRPRGRLLPPADAAPGRQGRARRRACALVRQRELDDGCQLLARTLFEARQLKSDDAWREARLSIENNRPRAAAAAAALVSPQAGQWVSELAERPARVIKRMEAEGSTGARGEVVLLGLIGRRRGRHRVGRLAAGGHLGASSAAAAGRLGLAAVGKQAALKLDPQAALYYARALKTLGPHGRTEPGWSDDTLGLGRARALRADDKTLKPPSAGRWCGRAVDAMSDAERRDSAWVYLARPRARRLGRPGEAGDADRAASRSALEQLASPLHFYGQLAAEDLGQKLVLPVATAAAAPSAAEADAATLAAARGNPGLQRALKLIAIGLRPEGVREWNWTLRGMDDRALLAAAQLACEQQVWDRCINTSERSKAEPVMAQRYPTPLREAVLAKSRDVGIDAAYVYGLIRQESRFIMDARSHVGASGLMQLMPATARWTAKKSACPSALR